MRRTMTTLTVERVKFPKFLLWHMQSLTLLAAEKERIYILRHVRMPTGIAFQ